MRIRGLGAKSETRAARYINLTVEDPITKKIVREVKVDKFEAMEAVEYLRAHNGNAPAFVHAFVDSVEIAFKLRCPA